MKFLKSKPEMTEEEAKRKTKNSLISSIFMLSITFVMLILTCSYAWFAMNKHLDSNGMHVSADVSPNLIIAKHVPAEGDNVISTMTETSTDLFEVAFTEDEGREQMKAATHGHGMNPSDLETDAFLWYNGRPEDIAFNTGLPKDPMRLILKMKVPVADDSLYYVDFAVDIASLRAPLEKMDLTAAITATEPSDATANDMTTHKAISVDFYLEEAQEANFIGTLNLAGLDPAANDASTAKANLKLIENTTIPLNTEDHITVVMRCYFDGALKETETTTFIKSSTISTQDLDFTVTFDATDTTAAS